MKNGRFAICPVKAWNKRGRSPDGEIRYWTQKDTGKKYPVIKFNGSFRHWGRWAWEQAFDRKLESMKTFLEYWNPTSNVSELVQDADKNQQLTVFMEQDNDLSKKLIDTLTDNIERVKENPDYIPQAQTINNSINSIVGVTKMRLDLLRYLQNNKKP